MWLGAKMPYGLPFNCHALRQIPRPYTPPYVSGPLLSRMLEAQAEDDREEEGVLRMWEGLVRQRPGQQVW